MSDAVPKNLKVISEAIDQHNRNCQLGPAVEVRMCAFEVERLGWDEIRNIPIVADPSLGTGRFRIVCASEKTGDDEEVTAVSKDRELQTA